METPRSGLLIALELFEFAEDMVRAKVLRRNPQATADEIEDAVTAWRTKGDSSLARHPEFHETWRDLS